MRDRQRRRRASQRRRCAVGGRRRRDEHGGLRIEPDDEGDLCGHGNACAGVIRALAPDCELHSVRVLGAGFSGNGALLLEGLRHALESGTT